MLEHIHVSQMGSFSPPSPGSDFKGNRWQITFEKFAQYCFQNKNNLRYFSNLDCLQFAEDCTEKSVVYESVRLANRRTLFGEFITAYYIEIAWIIRKSEIDISNFKINQSAVYPRQTQL